MSESTTYVSFRCDSALERQVRIEAAKRDMNRTQYIVEALKEKLRRVREEKEEALEAVV